MSRETAHLTLEACAEIRAVQNRERLTYAEMGRRCGVPRSTFCRALAGKAVWTVDVNRITHWLAEAAKPKEESHAK
jgi:hypothetical protein